MNSFLESPTYWPATYLAYGYFANTTKPKSEFRQSEAMDHEVMPDVRTLFRILDVFESHQPASRQHRTLF